MPVHTYEQLFPFIERLLQGEQNVLWPSEIKWFAKSSGTTNARSKFIPVSEEAMEECHFKGGKDLLSIYVNNFPDTGIFSGKGLRCRRKSLYQRIRSELDIEVRRRIGCVDAESSAVGAVHSHAESRSCIDERLGRKRSKRLAKETSKDDVTHIAGVPTWTVLLIQRIVELEKKSSILEVWPNLEVFFHGAVAFAPYRNLFKSLIPKDGMRYWETYNASEGFFGIQDQSNSEEMLLMLDYGVYYEFIPMEELGKEYPKTISLSEVEVGKNYAMVITTNAGLWRYNIGDTVKFDSISPYRIPRSRDARNISSMHSGEEIIIENADAAIAKRLRTDRRE